MGLILEAALHSNGISVPERAVNVFLYVQKDHLSKPYELQDGAAVLGEILEVKEIRFDGETVAIYPKRDVAA